MRNNILFVTAVMMLVFAGISGASAQDLSGISEKLDKLEARLNRLEAVQKRDVKKLEGRLTEVQSSPEEAGPDDRGIEDLGSRVDHLGEQIERSIAAFRSQMDRIVEDVDASVADLDLRMGHLAEHLERVKVDADHEESPEIVSGLAGDLRGLVDELREVLEGAPEAEEEAAEEEEEAEEPASVEIVGFADFWYVLRQAEEEGNDFEIGQVEVDLETVIDERIVVGVAVAYDPGGETFGLGAFTVDFHLFGSEGDHFRPVGGVDHSGIMVGQFDVPFGVDWNVYPSIDRKLVSGPLVVESTHDFWNDYGVQGYVETERVNGVVYVTNGFGYEGADEAGEPAEVEMKVSVGVRVGVKPNEMIEIGGSYAGFLDGDDEQDMSLMGAGCAVRVRGLFREGGIHCPRGRTCR